MKQSADPNQTNGGIVLPPAPGESRDPVRCWRAPVSIPTYEPMPPDKNPMFLERRVYQGSSGKVYPLPFIDRICERPTARNWDAIHLENKYIRLMILPELGGRIHIAIDKTNGYDFFYRQDVIKPALVGLAGPWISGGVEFNWPQHHRPSTFMPVDVQIQEDADGSRTVWLSEHEPMTRMKGMHGVCLHPDKAMIELKVRLYNRTEKVQTFLWWANAAVRVNEFYQSFFPQDVTYVADHAKRAMSSFPHCGGSYYGVNYAKRARDGVPPHERPRKFPPLPDYRPDDLSWYANIPVPTSYMAMGSDDDFFGGYDHRARAGVVHVADHHIAPGKKQWTWGNHEFGYAWDRNLSDDEAPYIELMAGVFTDNQPDFSFLQPGETRSFSQFWYPIQQIGPACKANEHAAFSLAVAAGAANIGVAVTSELRRARLRVSTRSQTIREMSCDLAPGKPLLTRIDLPASIQPDLLQLDLFDGSGRLLLSYKRPKPKTQAIPAPATEPALPADVKTNEELFLIGSHLQQYRHATRFPESYWREALRRDPEDVRCNNAMGLWHYGRGEFDQAEPHFRRAIARLTQRNPNPYDGEPYYNLGILLRRLNRENEAYDAFFKAAWNFGWQSAAYQALGEIDCRRHDWKTAEAHLRLALSRNSENLIAQNLLFMAQRNAGTTDAKPSPGGTLNSDPADLWARWLAGEPRDVDGQTALDIAIDMNRAGFTDDAIRLLNGRFIRETPGIAPLLQYYLAAFHRELGNEPESAECLKRAAAASSDYCFPSRLEDIAVLKSAFERNPTDAKAAYYLGNLLYDRRRYEEAIEWWEKSSRLGPGNAIVWRNLGIAYYNVRRDTALAREAYDKAVLASPGDARVLFERDQLSKRTGMTPSERLAKLEQVGEIVDRRDDLSVELSSLYNHLGRHEDAARLLARRNFQPWEGGEGLALGEYTRTHLLLGRQALNRGDADAAKQLFTAALSAPPNLGEAKHLLANQSDIHYWIGVASAATGDPDRARRHWQVAADSQGDFKEMSVRACSEMTFYSAMAMDRLGRREEARQLLNGMLEYAQAMQNTPATIDYFATSLPTMLLFEDDLNRRQQIEANVLKAHAKLGLGDPAAARAILNDVLRDDPNHAVASDLLKWTIGDKAH